MVIGEPNACVDNVNSMHAVPCVVCRERKNPHIGSELTDHDIHELQAKGMAVVIEQTHGSVVHVPAGWLHAVYNKRPCIKLAIDYMEKRNAALYMLVQQLIAEYIGPLAAPDYMPTSVCALNAINARLKRRMT